MENIKEIVKKYFEENEMEDMMEYGPSDDYILGDISKVIADCITRAGHEVSENYAEDYSDGKYTVTIKVDGRTRSGIIKAYKGVDEAADFIERVLKIKEESPIEKGFEKMKKYHNYIYDMFDLSTGLVISVTIYKDKAIVTNSNDRLWGEECKKTEVGSKLAETILLNLWSKGTEFGTWINNKSLPKYTNILEYKEEDFELPLNLMKYWQILRVICNLDDEEKIYQVDYYDDSEVILIQEFENENDINKFFEEYIEE